jgi:hypothetical protein
MRICIDSCTLIHGLQKSDPSAERLLDLIDYELTLVVPRLIAQEVTRNLDTPDQVRSFYGLFQGRDFAFIVDEPIPRELVERYVHLGLPAKADAFIGAFAEWMDVRYLISDNRHFLRDLKAEAFTVLDATDFLSKWERGEL